MDHRDSYCPYLHSRETTVKGTGLIETAGKEDPVELYSSLCVVKWIGRRRLNGRISHVKYHYACICSTHFIICEISFRNSAFFLKH